MPTWNFSPQMSCLFSFPMKMLRSFYVGGESHKTYPCMAKLLTNCTSEFFCHWLTSFLYILYIILHPKWKKRNSANTITKEHQISPTKTLHLLWRSFSTIFFDFQTLRYQFLDTQNDTPVNKVWINPVGKKHLPICWGMISQLPVVLKLYATSNLRCKLQQSNNS